eukprot:6232373-Amphidinium_carterae.1
MPPPQLPTELALEHVQVEGALPPGGFTVLRLQFSQAAFGTCRGSCAMLHSPWHGIGTFKAWVEPLRSLAPKKGAHPCHDESIKRTRPMDCHFSRRHIAQ